MIAIYTYTGMHNEKQYYAAESRFIYMGENLSLVGSIY